MHGFHRNAGSRARIAFTIIGTPEIHRNVHGTFLFAMTTILSLDQQADVARAVLVDERARTIATAQRDVPIVRPTRDREEQDPILLARAMLEAAIEVVESAPDPLGIAAIGISVPRDTIVLWDVRNGEPVAPAIVGRDIRSISACRALIDANFEPSIRHRASLTIDPRFAAPRLAWLLDQDARLRASAERGELAFGTLDSWLVWTLTGGSEHLTGIANAAGTSLYSLERHRWDERLGRIFGVPGAILPTIVPSSGLVAMLPATNASLDRLASALRAPLQRLTRAAPPKLPILAVTTERSAALVGRQCISPATASATFDDDGTTVLYNTGTASLRSRSALLTSIAWHRPSPDDGPPDPFGDEFLLPEFPVETWDSQLGWITTTEVVVFKYPVVLPQDREYAYCFEGWIDRAAPATDVDQVDRALALCDLVARMEDDMAMKIATLRVGGVRANDDRAMQVQADLLGVPVCRIDSPQTSAVGVAMLAGLAAGVWESMEAAARDAAAATTVRVFDPALDAASRRRRVLDFRAIRSCAAARAGTTTD